jgi:Tol biopolymer transport system component
VDPSATYGDGAVAAIVHDTLALVDLAEGSSQPLLEATLPTYTHLHFDWSPDGDKIVYGRLADLWLVDVKSHQTWNLTNTPDRWELLPSWSPDGETIAFTSRPLDPREQGVTEETMYGAFGGQLTLIQVDGSNYRLLDEQGTIRSSSPAWSPDAQRLAYASEGHLYVYGLEQEERRSISLVDYGLSSDLDACAPSWSPRGDEIAFFFSTRPQPQETSAEKGYAILNLTDHTSRVLKRYTMTETMSYADIPPGEHIGGCTQPPARWQPSGDHLLLRIMAIPRTNLQNSLSVIDAQGEREETLTGEYGAYQADWSPDGKWVVYVDNGDRSLNVVDPYDPDERHQILEPLCCSGVAWRPSTATTTSHHRTPADRFAQAFTP